ncbi:MAG TPA: hypothetical protein VGE98_02995 [Thermoanaerobaculia bacterium]
MTTKRIITTFAAACFLSLLSLAPAHAAPLTTKCEMDFTLKGWSAVYKTASGHGSVTCDNGQTAEVHISIKGVGATIGKSEVLDGHAKFTNVSDVKEVYGNYVAGGATVGVVKSGEAQVMTKGEVSMALAGKGNGVELGVSVNKFSITKNH